MKFQSEEEEFEFMAMAEEEAKQKQLHPSSPSRSNIGLGGTQHQPENPSPYGEELVNTDPATAVRMAMKPVKFVGDVAQAATTGWGNAIAQGVQDKGVAPWQVTKNLIKAGTTPIANLIGNPYQNPIQETGTSFERMGIPNKPHLDTTDHTGEELANYSHSGLANHLGMITDNIMPAVGLSVAKHLAKLGGRIAEPIIEKGLSKAESFAKIQNKSAGNLAQEMSSVSQEALRMRGTKEGRAALEANAGKENEIGQKLVEMMNNHEIYSPNKAKIDNAINGMGNVDIYPVVKALEDSKIKRQSGKILDHEATANKAIQKDIEALKGHDGEMVIPASELLDLRKGMDRVIDYNSQEGKILNNAKLNARYAAKNVLINKAKDMDVPEYVQGMEDWSKQLDAKDRLEHFLGTNKEIQQDRAEAFIHNLWGKNKKNRQKVMGDIGEIFGSNFVNESKLANLAAQLGPEGIPSWFSRSTTGRSKLGGALMLPFSSPKIASRITLPLAEFPEKSIGFFKKLLVEKSEAKQAAIANALNKMGVSDEAINKGLDHIIKQADAEPLQFGQPAKPFEAGQQPNFRVVTPTEAVLPPRRTKPSGPSNWPQTFEEPEAIKKVLNKSSRRPLTLDADRIQTLKEALVRATTKEQKQELLKLLRAENNAIPLKDLPETPVESVTPEIMEKLKARLKTNISKSEKQEILKILRDENYKTPLAKLK